MNAAAMLLANSSVPFSLYDFHLNGVSAQTLATAYSLPLAWVEERIEAVRLALKFQVQLELTPDRPLPPAAHGVVCTHQMAA